MKFFYKTLAILTLSTVIFSCNKREIIPAPTREVELKNHFIGVIDGGTVEFTENVNGFSGSSGVDLIINAAGMDSAVYHSNFSSTQTPQKISVGHGSLVFDWGSSERPLLSAFENYFLASPNQTPTFSNGGLAGFTVTYTDASGREWKSNEDHEYPNESVEYTLMAIESDASGDYAKFKVSFSTYVYSTYFDNALQIYITDSLLITNGTYTGWYKR